MPSRHPCFAFLLVVLMAAAARAWILQQPHHRHHHAKPARPLRTTALAVASTPAPSSAAGAGAAAGAAAAARRPRKEVSVLQVIESNGGYMAKVDVQNFNEKSSHTVIVSKELLDETRALAGREDFSVEDYFKAVFKFMMSRGTPLLNTEGVLTAGVFPINLFTVSQLSVFMDGCTEGIAEIIKEM